MVTRSIFCKRVGRPAALASILTVLCWTIAATPAKAAGTDDPMLDPAALAELQLRAEHAQPRDQCYLYTELVHDLTELAGRQMAAGEDEQAGSTMLQVDAAAAKVQQAADANAKKLKDAEEMLDHTTRRLADMVRVASDQQRAAMQATLRHLNAVHSRVLTLVFAR